MPKIEMREDRDHSTVIVGDFKTPFSIIDRKT